MSRVTSLTNMPEQQLNRWIKRIVLLIAVVLVAFVAFYAFDRWRPPAAPIVDRQLAAAEAAVQENPGDIAARGRLADLYTVNERYEDAIAQYNAILDTGEETKLAHFGRAHAYKGLGELDAAAADFQVVVDIAKEGEMANVDPVLNAAYYGLGEIALAQGRTEDAIANLEAAVRIKRSDADSQNLLGAAYLKAGEADKAIEAAQRAIAFVPLGWSEPYQTLAGAYTAIGDTAHATWASAMANLATGDAEGAKASLLEIVDGPAALDATIGLGLVAESQGDLVAAADWYRKALAVDPENPSVKLGLERVADLSDASRAPAEFPLPVPSTPGDAVEGNG